MSLGTGFPIRGRGRGLRISNESKQSAVDNCSSITEQKVMPTLSLQTSEKPSFVPAANPLTLQNVDAGGDDRSARRSEYIKKEDQSLSTSKAATKCGTTGQKVVVQSNYFIVSKRPNWSIYQYRTDFFPDIEMMRARRAYLAQHKDKFNGYIFDGTTMFTATYLGNAIELLSKNHEDEIINIKIKHVATVETTDQSQLQVLNLILRRTMTGLKLQNLGRNFYDPVNKIDLKQHGLEIWPGYVTSIRQHENEILLCCKIAHKVMRTETLYDLLKKCRSEKNPCDAFKRLVVGSIVITDYNNRTYRVDDVDFKTNPKTEFDGKSGPISFLDYYKKSYNIQIRDPSQPLLVSCPTERNRRGGKTENIMLVPELARSTGMTSEMRSNFRLMRDVAVHTRLAPQQLINRLKNFQQRIQETPTSVEVLKNWNMKLDPSLVNIPARVLPSPAILFGNNERYKCNADVDWTREFRNKKMFASKDIRNLVVIAPQRNVKDVQRFVQMCIDVAKKMKMQIAPPKYELLLDDRTGSYVQAIDKAIQSGPQFLMIILTNQNEEKYSCIKKRCCVDHAIPSQVCTLSKIAPPPDKSAGLMSIATKVVIQINAKIFGAPWFIDLPIKNTMFIGFDVCHSAKDRNKSYGAFIATMDMKISTKYFSHVVQHMKGQELSTQIAGSMTKALRAYYEEHGTLPSLIIFYRDGVGDGQLHQVENAEIEAIKQRLNKLYEPTGMKCKMAFIVVSKRINTRLMLSTKNPDAGTVVDDIITLPERYDFFLVSQSVRQGTVSPTSYNILYDTTGLNADKLQMLTYMQTHLYYNWSGTCSVPAVCQYAHKLSFFVAEHIHQNPHNGLERQLYFL